MADSESSSSMQIGVVSADLTTLRLGPLSIAAHTVQDGKMMKITPEMAIFGIPSCLIRHCQESCWDFMLVGVA